MPPERRVGPGGPAAAPPGAGGADATPFGAWPSPVTPALLVAGAVGLSEVQADGQDLWWSEARPEEGGRVQLVRRAPDGTTTDVLPDGFAARTRVHEYGGGAWTVRDAVVWFSNWADQRLYRLDPGGEPRALTPEPTVPGGRRYADMDVAPDGTWLVAVREDHGDGMGEAVNQIVAVDTADGSESVLVGGADFVASPRVDRGGGRLAWTQWDHPDMPWDAAEAWVADLAPATGAPGGLAAARRIAGGSGEWVAQPTWAPDGSLWFASDLEERSDLYRWNPATDTVEMVADRTGGEVATPPWVFRMSRYAHQADGRIPVAFAADGVDHLAVMEADDHVLTPLDGPWTSITSVVPAPGGMAAVAAGFTAEPAIVAGPPEALSVIRAPRDLGLRPEQISRPESIDFPSTGGRRAHALYYPPTSPGHAAPAGERPPLLVDIHGGPTAAARSQFQLGVQFWTSRGFAVVDVNYGGSTGYGRAYRDRLRGQWGVVDVEDCAAAARFLADRGDVDPDRLAIRGGSAGGFTTLAALAFHDTFAAGVSRYGVADLAVLARDTHKFESRYLDSLVGPWPAAEDLYRQRSPLFHAERIDVPLLVLQGLEDEVVPPNQSELIVDALRANGVPVAYLAFAGEQHGFRRAATIVRAAEAELSFYGQVFGFDPAGAIEPVLIENL